MPRIVQQPADLGDMPRLYDEKQAPTIIRAGRHKWQDLRDQIPYVKIGRSRFWTDAALLAFIEAQTHQPKPPPAQEKPRRGAPRKAVPPPLKGRRKRDAERRAAP